MDGTSSSLIEFFGTGERSNCGYCKNERGQRTPNSSVKEDAESEGNSSAEGPDTPPKPEDSSIASALTIISISPDHLMHFEEAGWSTSGRYLYKPNNRATCCPQFTIRLDVTKFKMSRSQKRAMRQMNEFLKSGKRPVCGIKEEDPTEKKVSETTTSSSKEQVTSQEPPEKKVKDADRPVLKKKEIRNKRFEEKCRDRNLDPDALRAKRRAKEAARQRTIKSYIDEARPDWQHKLELKTVAVGSTEFSAMDNESFELYKKYQTTIHKEDVTRLAGYRKFLCDSPLKRERQGGVDLGSFHLRFLLDGKLIAVSVIDILPDCLSAKYMFYDPDYSFLSIGTYTALREIEYTQQLEHVWSRLKYYYMGFYIHSCPKMRYKSKFRPSDLLCEDSFQWLDFDSCQELLDNSPNRNDFAVFRPDVPPPVPIPFGDLIVYANGAFLRFSTALIQFPEVAQDQEFLQKVRELSRLIGPHLKTVVFYFRQFNPQ